MLTIINDNTKLYREHNMDFLSVSSLIIVSGCILMCQNKPLMMVIYCEMCSYLFIIMKIIYYYSKYLNNTNTDKNNNNNNNNKNNSNSKNNNINNQ